MVKWMHTMYGEMFVRVKRVLRFIRHDVRSGWTVGNRLYHVGRLRVRAARRVPAVQCRRGDGGGTEGRTATDVTVDAKVLDATGHRGAYAGR